MPNDEIIQQSEVKLEIKTSELVKGISFILTDKETNRAYPVTIVIKSPNDAE